ncbi:DUF554 domain-containing protein [Salisediminibacterium halotolerans]|uniref:DUF554 domain-containing protein n=1 Tax=Salisediminibacterium halotolerans TaxID=517425 RepID=A0A1H9WJX2_9BACI|nr:MULTISPECIES: DUF554 domain-containing protein [Salisediminibacterium]RLJ69722.1 hypothetical protein BCL39_2592 [Actinophytocola xinjiangensis]RPE89780.1 hypothetical protein EDD67_0563 [Salisediminibacterium halotolerans]TWG32616.1 hypothetical protein BCL52_2587 [Salisediminibacterium halotolerans]SES33743.1 hypothetical protein SAMN05444126_1369 [Salisediminibacterium haloalkalitolerans]GEL07572.1 membrane protein [Salisediminibacterium halotolerans]
MVLFGTIVNGLAIILGAWIGMSVKGFSRGMQETVMKAIGLSVFVLGLTMAFEGDEFLLLIFSLAIGAIIGERMNLEGKLNEFGNMLERRLNKQGHSTLAEGFVAATLLFVVGAMAIVGALDSGFRGDHSVLLTKSLLDGFSSIVFAATMGIGVMFSAVPVVLYQGAIALAASWIVTAVPEQQLNQLIDEITAVGGIMIMAIGLNLLGLEKIRVANLLPAILLAVLFSFASRSIGL